MLLTKTTILKLLYEPKKLIFSRSSFALVTVSVIVGGVVYIKQHATQKHVLQQATVEMRSQGKNYAYDISALQAHITALNSRISHLSEDNKRLSSTGQKLALKLRDANSSVKEQLAQTKELQLELYAIDQHLIQKYDTLIEQQKTVVELKLACEKNKDKNKKCEKYEQSRQALDSIVSQLKFLKSKREVLISEIARSSGTI